MRQLNDLCLYLQKLTQHQLIGQAVDNLLPLSHLHTDSRQLEKQSVFIALPGTKQHGNAYIDMALAAGAACVITDSLPESPSVLALFEQQAALLVVPDLMAQLPALAAWFYGNPAHQINVIGITGTNGKTSTAFYTAQLLSRLEQGNPVALMGTLGNGTLSHQQDEDNGWQFKVDLKETTNTTVDVVNLNRHLRDYVNQGLHYCVMEVSSHALVLGRIAGLAFNAVALTQVTRDHLDFHQTEQAYQAAKAQLFESYPATHRVLNSGDALGRRLLLKRAELAGVFSYGVGIPEVTDLSIQQLKLTPQGVQFSCAQGHDVLAMQSHLMGAFNVENLACAMSLCVVNGFTLPEIQKHLPYLKPVTGRMEKVLEQPLVLVDYAHTPDALESVLKGVGQHFQSAQKTAYEMPRLWVVFGCGGNRDQGKRPLMGRVAELYADQVVLTDDNPRCEASYDILTDIQAGLTHQALVIPDRKTAIETVLAQAGEQDVILIAGKGHETYQAFCDTQIYFSDQATVLAWKRNHDLDS